MTPFGWLLFGLVIAAGSWQWSAWLLSACQFLLDRSAPADRESSSPSSLPGEGGHDGPERHEPHADPSSVGTPLSSSPRACGCSIPDWLPCACAQPR